MKNRSRKTQLSAEVHIHTNDGVFLTPRRIRLLEAIDKYGSITKAAKRLSMSYKTAWDSVHEMNCCSNKKLVISDKNIGSHLTDTGRFTLNMYYGIEKACNYGVMHMNERIG